MIGKVMKSVGIGLKIISFRKNQIFDNDTLNTFNFKGGKSKEFMAE